MAVLQNGETNHGGDDPKFLQAGLPEGHEHSIGGNVDSR
jgi:hypothetical protein